MDRAFKPLEWEEKLYEWWEKNGYLKPQQGKPFTILMPPPNANASLHAGHGMYTIDDIMIRWKRLQGYAALWIPGLDHAGFETQFVYEKHLKKKGLSRTDFDRKTLYNDIASFVHENSGTIYSQFKRLGFLADWERSVFTLDPKVISYVHDTFTAMHRDELVYRDEYIVNYCPHCGTSLADLETKYLERKDPLYYIRYGDLVLATVRPETKCGDTALAVHPDDARYTKWVGSEITVNDTFGRYSLKVIADAFVDPAFGTGVVKITPAHDPHDFEVGRRHGLDVRAVIGFDGRMNAAAGPLVGMSIKKAREAVVADLTERGLIEKVDHEYEHSVTTCYKCSRDVEPMVSPNWFIKVDGLKKRVTDAIVDNQVQFYPAKYKEHMMKWLDIMHDWPISRQIVWGIRIPVWYKVNEHTEAVYVWWIDKDGTAYNGTIGSFLKKGVELDTVIQGLQKVMASTDVSVEYTIADTSPGTNYLPETDTFDTWFSSGQWPLVTMSDSEYNERFPTDFIGTLSDILKFWISRMILFSLYRRDTVPFKHVYLWPMVSDAKGAKMSKSKGNVVDPIKLVDAYGADAFRAALLFGAGEGGKVNLSEEKVRAMRNYANKVWNIGRFIHGVQADSENHTGADAIKVDAKASHECHVMLKEFDTLRTEIAMHMDAYHFSRAFDVLYEFVWHRLADIHVEKLKDWAKSGNIEVLDALKKVYLGAVVLLHPFMPFVTEAVWKEYHGESTSILDVRSDNS